MERKRGPDDDVDLGTIAGWVKSSRHTVALTGAGISTESGIPDFRGPQGIWTKNPKAERLSHISHYMADPEVRVLAWKSRLEHPAWSATPNEGHRALAELERKGRLHSLITQNVDGLHQKAGNSDEITIEVHGSIREVVCMHCGERAPMEKALDRVRSGEADPPCRSCGGILKSATVSFGQSLDPADLSRAQRDVASCECFLAIGTSLAVYPVALLPRIALEARARVAIFNAEPTPYDDMADAVVRGSAGRALAELVQLL
jgi:NAD-dependent deacetylase